MPARRVGRRALQTLMHDHATVNRQGLAVDVGGPLARQERHHRRHVLRRAEAPGRDLLQVGLLELGGEGGGHVRLDEAGRHRVHRHALAGVLAGQRLGEADQAGLGGDVVGLAGVAAQRHHRAEVHHAPEARAQHAAQGGLGEVEGAREVGVDDRLPVVVLHAQHQAVAGDAGVVDEHVEAPEALDHALDQRLAGGGVGDVGAEGGGLPAGGLDGLHDLLGGAGRGDVVHRHAVALPAEALRHGAAEAAAGARHEHDAPFVGATSIVHWTPSWSAAWSDAGSSTDTTWLPGRMRPTSPASTLPEPNSTKRVAPSSCSLRTHSTQRTGAVTCSVRSAGASAADGSGAAVTLHTMVKPGSAKRVAARSGARRSAAGRISEQWKGALTFRGITRPPRSFSRALARSTPAALPETTVWPGELRLATSATAPAAVTSARAAAIVSSSSFSTAAMAPSPAGTASCM